ncbi:XRE family transcriptional regulator [Pseudomonas sp. NPDC079086]|uniref:XRE family transcriptional regulator n=1 Tax=unclassified Pseudomonas TaxID=196821 RepID=UPI0037CB26F6
MSNLKDRIKSARAHAGLTQLELAKKVGVSQPVISQLEKGENLQSVHLVKIANTCRVDAAWLAEGAGEMIPGGADSITAKPGESSAEIVRRMLERSGRNLPAETRDRIISAVEAGSDESSPANNVITGDFSRPARLTDSDVLIPQYDVRASMGHGQVPADYVDFVRNVVVSGPQLERLGLEYTSPANLSIITGWGQSMEGTINDKDPVIVDRGVNEFAGDGVYVLTWAGDLYIKRLQKADAGRFDMISDNEKHKDRTVPVEDVTIHAKVLLVWNAKKL